MMGGGRGIKEKDKVQMHGGSEDQREATFWRSQAGVASPLLRLLLCFQPAVASW